MRALVCSSFDGPAALAVGKLPELQSGPRDVLVEAHAVSLTFMDCLMVSGQYQLRPPLPFAPGTEAAAAVPDGGRDPCPTHVKLIWLAVRHQRYLLAQNE